jgi:hypothetical protein
LESPYASQEMRDNFAVTTLPGVPWIGGDILSFGKMCSHTLSMRKPRWISCVPEQKETQVKFFEAENVLPARADAYDELTFPLETTAVTVQKILKTGRPHPPLRLWRRIEAFLDEMLLDIGSTVLKQPATSVSEITERMLGEYEYKLAAVLKG